MKNCRRCKQDKFSTEFSPAPRNADGLNNTCKPCVVERNREYWRTSKGRISQIYAVQCVNSRQRQMPAPSYSRKELEEWAEVNGLALLMAAWEKAGYPKDLTPSVDRLDPTQPYTLGNVRFVTWAENNNKAYEDRKECRHVTKQNRKVEQLTLNGTHVAYFDSIAAAARASGATRTNINQMCRGAPQIKSVGGFIWRYR